MHHRDNGISVDAAFIYKSFLNDLGKQYAL